MSAIHIALTILNFLLMSYLVLIMIRVLASWFSGNSSPPIIEFVGKLTDPWLNLFRSWKFLRFQFMDMTPLVAIGILLIIYNVTSTLLVYQSIWFGLVLSIVISVVGMTIQSIFMIFGALALIRLIAIFARASSVQRVWFTLDHILQPLVYPVATRFSPNRVLPYGTGLGIFLGLNIAAWFLCRYLFNLLANLAAAIPF